MRCPRRQGSRPRVRSAGYPSCPLRIGINAVERIAGDIAALARRRVGNRARCPWRRCGQTRPSHSRRRSGGALHPPSRRKWRRPHRPGSAAASWLRRQLQGGFSPGSRPVFQRRRPRAAMRTERPPPVLTHPARTRPARPHRSGTQYLPIAAISPSPFTLPKPHPRARNRPGPASRPCQTSRSAPSPRQSTALRAEHRLAVQRQTVGPAVKRDQQSPVPAGQLPPSGPGRQTPSARRCALRPPPRRQVPFRQSSSLIRPCTRSPPAQTGQVRRIEPVQGDGKNRSR